MSDHIITSLRAELKGVHMHVAVFVNGGLSGTLVVHKDEYGRLERWLQPAKAPEFDEAARTAIGDSVGLLVLETLKKIWVLDIAARMSVVTGIARYVLNDVAAGCTVAYEMLAIKLASRLIEQPRLNRDQRTQPTKDAN